MDKNCEEQSQGLLTATLKTSTYRWFQLRATSVIIIEISLVVLLATYFIYVFTRPACICPPITVFCISSLLLIHCPLAYIMTAPAQDIIRYKEVGFSSGFPPYLNEYQGPPSPEINKAWRDLYNCK